MSTDLTQALVHQLAGQAARIAELEADREAAFERIETKDALIAKLEADLVAEAADADSAVDSVVAKVKWYHGEIAALKAQRCETCGHFVPAFTKTWCDRLYDDTGHHLPITADFACNRWAERSET